ncbi:NAD-dependent epimerase/dehydratase family protein [Arenimonas aestuarii]
MRIAVSGASGFLGRHTCAALAATGADLVLLRHASDPGLPSAQVVHADLGQAPDPELFDRLGRPDALLHLAWGGLPNYASPHHVQQELPRHTRFLESLLRSGLRRLVVAGTCLEYGLREGALDESMPAAPTTAYGQAKDALRRHLQTLQAELGFDLAWARLFYLYGPGQAPTSLYSLVQAAARCGDPSLPMSPGDQERDFLPAAEAGRLLAWLCLNAGNVGVVNICSGKPVAVRTMAETWLAELGSGLRLDTGRLPYPSYEPFAFWGRRDKLDGLLESA